jgi:hypothetical protein
LEHLGTSWNKLEELVTNWNKSKKNVQKNSSKEQFKRTVQKNNKYIYDNCYIEKITIHFLNSNNIELKLKT